MRVRMLRQISGTRNGSAWPAPGGEIELPDDEALTLCRQHMAEPVPAAKAETAAAPKPNTRARRRAG